MHLTFIGIAPERRGELAFDTDTSSGRRLWLLLPPQWRKRSRVDLKNLLATPCREGNVAARRAWLKRAAAKFPLVPDRMHVLCGYEVMRAFGAALFGEGVHRSQIGPLSHWRAPSGLWFALLPHPSGRNRWYNDPKNCLRAAEAIRYWMAPEVARYELAGWGAT